VPDLPAAIARCGRGSLRAWRVRLVAIGHRVVHGGPDLAAPVLVDEAVMERLARLADARAAAPAEQPRADPPSCEIDPGCRRWPASTPPSTAAMPARPTGMPCRRSFYDEGVRRYGFHGLSYEYVADRLAAEAPEVAAGRVVVAHLGSGASMCALRAGRSVESTMGFTALDGVPMGTRPGQLDPGVVLYLFDQKGMSAREVADLLYRESGLKGLSGISNDMRDLLESDRPEAAFAIDHFVHRCALNAGMLAAALGGIDGFVFTAGIGERSAPIRARIADASRGSGATLDPVANAAAATVISAPDSRFPLFVIPTDEELMIARHTLAVVSAGRG
jgi:acetate kinase